MGLAQKMRPKTLKGIVGQKDVVTVLDKLVSKQEVPQTMLLCGPAGCGKTTIGRILKNVLRCSNTDFHELNAAKNRGIDTIRGIEAQCGLQPLQGDCKIYLIDEAHQLTPEAQDASLKILEEPPSHVYFILATTNPDKLKNTIRTRCTTLKLGLLSISESQALAKRTCQRLKLRLDTDVFDQLITRAEGSARTLLTLLDAIRGLPQDDQLQYLENTDQRKQAITLARALINPRSRWKEVAAIIKGLDDDPEQLRHMVLGYANTIALGGGKMTGRAMLVIEAFRDNFYDAKKSGLIAACHEVVEQNKP